MIHEVELDGMTWYWLSRSYLNERVASAVFERSQRYAKRRQGLLDAGVYRHGHEGVGMVYITAVSHRPDGLAELSNVLMGTEIDIHPEWVLALIARRMRVLGDLLQTETPFGSHRIHHEGPTVMRPSGEMEDGS